MVAPKPQIAAAIVDPEFTSLLPDTLQELPTNAPASGNSGVFDNMVPMGLAPPAAANV